LDSPALPLIRTGLILWMMAGAYVWTEFAAGPRWSWMQALGRNSLMVYWVHVMMVYGSVVRPIKRSLSILQSGTATLIVTLMMIALSALWLRWKRKKGASPKQSGDAPHSAPLATTAGGGEA
jgi:fucose 4-O-acetylase-like acetyltransferase